MNHTRKYGPSVALLAIVLLITAACGIKPKQLTPPSAEQGDSFPHNYPAPDAK